MKKSSGIYVRGNEEARLSADPSARLRTPDLLAPSQVERRRGAD